jgi:putative thioredoxin
MEKLNLIEINSDNFEESVVKKSKELLVIVDFWAQWCTPCLMLGPVLESVAKKHKGKVLLAKINVDQNPELSERWEIDGIPAVKIFRNGKVVDEFVGFVPESEVLGYIEKHLDD